MRYALLTLLLFSCIDISFSSEVINNNFQWQATENNQSDAPIGKAPPNYTLTTSPVYEDFSLFEKYKNEIFLLAVRDPDCPISRRYATKLNALKDEGLNVIFLLTGQFAEKNIADKDRQRHNINGTYILDKDRKLSTWLGVQTSAEVYLFDKNTRLRYRGAIDDQYGLGFSKTKANQTFLNDALHAVRNNAEIEISATSAPGCIIRTVENQAPHIQTTWNNDIHALIHSKCQSCHRPGQAGPFSLLTYQQVVQRKEMIRFVLENKIMPPWSLTNDSDRFTNNEKFLSDIDRKKIINWIDAGTPKGTQTNNRFIADKWVSGWKYGEPDVILTSPVSLIIPADGEIEYKYISIPTSFEQDRWVHTVEVATDTPENTHHIILFVLPPEDSFGKFMSGAQSKTDLNRMALHKMALKGFFSGYIPGLPGLVYENNSGKLLPKGWRIVMQVHHQSNGKEVVDTPRVGLQFLDRKPEKPINTLAATNIKIHIPAGKANHLETAEYKFDHDGEIIGLYPHMHLRGSAFKYELIGPNGSKNVLLDIPNYDPNWQQYYQFQKPIQIEKGMTLLASAWFDNSEQNLNNPDPTVDVTFGLRTRDEMLIGYFDWVDDK